MLVSFVLAAPTPAAPNAPQGAPELMLGADPQRTSPVALNGQVVAGELFVFASSTPEISDVFFYLDQPISSGMVFQHEGHEPYDFAGTAAGGLCRGFDSRTLADGPHRIEARVVFANGSSQDLGADFTVQNSTVGQLLFTPQRLELALEAGESETSTVILSTGNGEAVDFTLDESSPWLSLGASGGTTPASVDVIVNSAGLTTGVYSAIVVASSLGRPPVTLVVEINVEAPAGDLVLSPTSLTLALEPGAVVSNVIDISTTTNGAADYTLTSSSAWLTLGAASGTTPSTFDVQVNATGLADGTYQASVTATSLGRPDAQLMVDISVTTPPASLAFTPAGVLVALAPDQLGTATVELDSSTGEALPVVLSESADWLALEILTGTTPVSFDLLLDTAGLADGVYQANVLATSPGLAPVDLAVELTVGDPTLCAPLPCDQILVDLPISLEFRADEGGIQDVLGQGTGFTTIDAPDGSLSYRQDLLFMDAAVGVLELTTTRGIHYKSANDQANTLGVGIDPAAGIAIARTKLLEPTAGTGNFEQAGLWFGSDEDNFIKFVVASTRNGSVVHGLMEVDGIAVSQTSSAPIDFTAADLSLSLVIDPVAETVAGFAALNDMPAVQVMVFAAPASFFGVPPAVVDPAIGTNSFVGLFGTHRYGPAPVIWRFEGFQVDLEGQSGGPQLEFDVPAVAFDLGPAAAASATVAITLTTGDSVPYTLEEFEPWLTLGAQSGATPSAFEVAVDTTGLADGSYEGTVTAIAPGLPTVALPVTLEVVSPVGELEFAPATVALELPPGGSATRALTLSTTGGGAATFTLSESASWLSLDAVAGVTPASLELLFDATGLADGVYQAMVQASSPEAQDLLLPVQLTVATPPGQFVLSPPSLDFLLGAASTDVGAVEVSTTSGEAVSFTLSEAEDWLTLSATTGTTPASMSATVDSSGLANGVYLAQVILLAEDPTGNLAGFDERVLTIQLTVDAPPAELVFAPGAIEFALETGEVEMATAQLTTTTGALANYELAEETSWLELSAPMGTTPMNIGLSVDAAGMDTGVYQAVVTATATGFSPVNLAVQLTVGDPTACSPLDCEAILVDLPYVLTFTQDHGGIPDGAGSGTGFTTIDAPNGADSYRPELLFVDSSEAVLELTTTAGLHHRSDNSQVNTLGVGIDAPNQVAIVKTTLVEPDVGTGRFEQGGLWFGIDNDNFVKFVVASTRTGTRLHGVMEVGGVPAATITDVPRDFTGTDVELEFVIDPENERVTGYATVGLEARREIVRFTPPAAFFSFDAAGINPAIGTRSFVGVFGSHRHGPTPVVYRFRGFSIEVGETADSGGGLAFDRSTIPAEDPTNLTWGPDDRLYVTSLLGRIEANTLDPLNQVVATQTIHTLTSAFGSRLTLGIAIGPESTSSDVVLYVAHSNASLNNGQLDSAIVSRISGPNLDVLENVITGLPRAPANHSINSIHFGPDGRLYIAVGSNTGSGATNTAQTEFGDRAEQPLSAAILVADLHAVGFDGTCQNVIDPLGIPPCSVAPWSTGVRNMYDFVFHSNGNVYGPDNGLGAIGTFPPSASAPCFGYGDIRPVGEGGQNPGTQNDSLYLLVEGGYYGHPNPSRGECVFGDGGLQGVPALPNYRAPMFNLGAHRSANGITEYPFDVGCVPLGGDLLIANYSVGDNITRIVLSPDGQSVVADEIFATGFVNPIALTTNPEGTIFVAELGSDRVTALVPRSLGCWLPRASMNQGVVYAASAAALNRLYVVGGRGAAGPVTAVTSYDPSADVWIDHADRPGPALEGAAACSANGSLYVFGGATGAIGTSVATAAAYDPAGDAWTALPPMATPRAYATATWVGGRIYVVGGVNVQGASLATGEVFDPATGTWSPMADMATARDSAGAFGVAGELHVVGGRTLAPGGQPLAAALASHEAYDAATDTWVPRAAVPTARQAPMTCSLEGRVQIVSGIDPAAGADALRVTEEYDPATDSWRSLATLPEGRYGAASATFGAQNFIAGGSSGAAISAEQLSFEF